jgi:hypothetical protein
VLSNDRETFDEISGDTMYGSLDHREAKKYRQQIMFNNEGALPNISLNVNVTNENWKQTIFIFPRLLSIEP